MTRLGHRPTTRAQGVGEMATGTTRASILGSFQQATWVTSISWWGGRSGNTNAQAGPAVYAVNGSNELTTRLWYGGTQTVTQFMSPSDPTTGGLMTRPVSNLLLLGGQVVAGAIANASGGSLAYGQDNSGHPMHYASSAAPSPWAYRATNPILAQGKIHVSLEGVTNRAPNRPTITSPLNNSQTVDTTPTVSFSFSDPDSTYGDYIAAYRVEVFNETNTSRLHDSGWTNTSSGEQSAGAASYTLPTLSTGQQVRIVVTVRDRAAAVSLPAEIRLSIITAGTFTPVGISNDAGSVQVDGIGTVRVITNTQPTFVAQWNHSGGLAADTVDVRIVKVSDGSVYRAIWTDTTNVNSGANGTYLFSSTGWAALAAGDTVYRYEIRGTDTDGGVSAWAQSQPFMVNAAPTVFLASPGDGATRSTVPSVTAILSDATDDQSTLTVSFEFEHIASTDTFEMPGRYVSTGLAYWGETLDTVARINKLLFFTTHSYGDYRWRVLATDPWGATLTGAWRTFTYAEPPQVTVTNPADESTITTGTPTITATVDRTLAKYRITIKRADYGTPIYDSGEVDNATSSISHDIPGGVLPNKVDYDLTIWVRTADTLENSVTTQFTLEYEPPDVMTGVTAEAVRASEFDRGQPSLPEQLPNVELHWDLIDIETVDDEDWLWVNVYRISGDGRNRHWRITDRNQTAFTDTTPAANVPHDYYVGYERKINDGLDTIESVLAKFTVNVTILYTTITSEFADDPAVALHYWNEREVEPVTDIELVEVFGEPAPVAFQGVTDYDVLSGEFMTLDDRSGEGWYSARDVVDAVRELKGIQPVTLEEAVINAVSATLGQGIVYGPTARTLTLRDPKGRVIPGIITRGPRETDHYRHDRATFALEFTQVARPVSQIVAVNDAEAIDVTEGYPA